MNLGFLEGCRMGGGEGERSGTSLGSELSIKMSTFGGGESKLRMKGNEDGGSRET